MMMMMMMMMMMWFDQLEIIPVPVLYRGPFDLEVLEKLAETIDPLTSEGFVARLTDAIHYDEFNMKVAKWVRKGHVQTSEHWMHQTVIANGLCDYML